MAWACCLLPSFLATSHGIAPMVDPSWCTGHCAPVLCVGILVRVSYRLEPSDHGIAPMVSSAGSPHKASMPSCLRGERVGRTRPHAVAATGCTAHMLWSPCVLARVASCVFGTPRPCHGAPLVRSRLLLVVPSFESPTPPLLKSNTGRFHCFLRRHQYV